jgi:F-type H+-transporting ATPase subunit b
MPSARRSSSACSVGRRRDPLTVTSFEPAMTPQHHSNTRRRAAIRVLLAVVAVVCLAAGARVFAAAQPPVAQPAESHQPGQPAAAEAHEAEGAGEGGHGESPWAVVARIVNFAILAGGLFYLLRSPLAGFLEQRGITVRSELKAAADLRKEAGAQIAAIDAKMRALPGEIEALERRGAEEIKAEEARIEAQADAERRRLLEQAKREIDTQLRVAERDLKKRAGELAVDVATERAKRTITDRDHAWLVDRYVSQVRH